MSCFSVLQQGGLHVRGGGDAGVDVGDGGEAGKSHFALHGTGAGTNSRQCLDKGTSKDAFKVTRLTKM